MRGRLRLLLTVFILFLLPNTVTSRRKSQSGLDRVAYERNDDEKLDVIADEDLRPWMYTTTSQKPETGTVQSSFTERKETSTTEKPTTTTEAVAVTEEEEVTQKPDEIQKLLSDGVHDIANLTQQLEEEHAEVLEDSANRTVLWLDSKWKSEDFGLNASAVKECVAWRKQWEREKNVTVEEGNGERMSNETDTDIAEEELELLETELVDKKKRLKEIGLDEELLKEYKAIGIIYKEVCGEHERDLWFRNREDAKKIGVGEQSPICEPFKEELNPDTTKLAQLAELLNNLVVNVTEGGMNITNGNDTQVGNDLLKSIEQMASLGDDMTNNPMEIDTANADEKKNSLAYEGDKDAPWGVSVVKELGSRLRRGVRRMKRMATETEVVADHSDEWLDEGAISSNAGDSSAETVVELVDENGNMVNVTTKTNIFTYEWLEIDATEEANPILSILRPDALAALGLDIPSEAFKRYQKVSLYLPGICADFVPKAVDEFDSSSFEGVEIEGPIGVNVSALEAAGVNLTALAEKLRNDTEVDDVLCRTNVSIRTLGGSFIMPVLNKNQYDPFSAPIVFQGSAVVVRFGIYIESMSNFQTSTMDYDMDIYLMMSWRDPRLVNPYDRPIIVKEEEILEKIWRPDPFFANAKEAEFHEVTFLNFLMRIFPDGIVLYETRIKLRPACNLILCKYPHDKQTCELQIKSFAYPIETVRFEWFTRKKDAIDKNPDVKLPELYIDRYEPRTCNKTRKSGDFSCLRAVFRLKRDVGFHVAQTYIPTSLALMFSWVGVWLPEEFMEGRIGVAITVLLTLSTESAGAREHLPSVSYLKAIDLWFGFITGFVFFTLLQTLFVIGFDKRASQLRKWAMKKKADVTEELRDAILTKANRYHKTGRYLDNFCRVFYPLSFLLFLIMYYFVFTEGRQDDCIQRR